MHHPNNSLGGLTTEHFQAKQEVTAKETKTPNCNSAST